MDCFNTSSNNRPTAIMMKLPRRTRSMSSCSSSSNSSSFPSPYEPSDWDSSAANPGPLQSVLQDLENRTRECGPYDEIVANHWNSLGLIRLHMQRNVQAAIKCHTVALQIYRKTASTSIQIAVCLADLAACHERLSESKRAKSLFQEALDLLESSVDNPKSCIHLSITRSLARLERN